MDTFAAGQQWTFDTPPGFEDARLVIGAVLRFDNREPIVCCSVLRAPRRTPDGHVEPVDIPFIPFAAPALAGSVRSRDGDGTPAEGFAAAFADWRGDARGLTVFTVRFDGFLDRLIARQMAAIIGVDAA